MKTVMCDLPCRVRGYVKETCEPDGDYYTIVLNNKLSHETLCETYLHEEEHIEYDDFHSPLTATEIEYLRHK